MSKPLFAASYAKLRRASHFIAELEANIQANKLKVEQSARHVEGGAVAFDLAAIEPLPGLIVGDAIHNLRTSLDLMASELVALKNLPTKKVYFPFASSASDMDAQIKAKSFDKAGVDAVNLLKSFTPYTGGNQMLRDLHDLDIQDKHSALLVAMGRLRARTVVEDTTSGPQSVLTIEDLAYLFPAGSPFSGCVVLDTLENLVKIVDGILEAFAGLVAARGP